MQAKGCIQGTVPWEHARQFLHARLQRRLPECRWVKRIEAVIAETTPRTASSSLAHPIVEHWRAAQAQLNEWVRSAAGSASEGDKLLADDKAWFAWFQSNESKLETAFAAFKRDRVIAHMKHMLSAGADSRNIVVAGDASGMEGLAGLVSALTPEQKEALKKIL
jgi:hypothetical protein